MLSMIAHRGSLNPLPLCRGRRDITCQRQAGKGFKSTPSMQRETGIIADGAIRSGSLNPLPLCRGRQQKLPFKTITIKVFCAL